MVVGMAFEKEFEWADWMAAKMESRRELRLATMTVEESAC